MNRKHLRAANLVLYCLACIATEAPTIPAQRNTPPEEIYPPPRYEHTRLSDGAAQFIDLEMGVSFALPRDWEFGNQGSRFLDRGWKENLEGDLATTVLLHHRHTNEDMWLYYCIRRHVDRMTPEQINKWLLAEVDDKTSQRRMQYKLKNYHVRPSTYEPEQIGGQRALAWVADFTEGKIDMIEYFVLARSTSNRTLVEFSIRYPASELDTVRRDVDPIIKSLEMR